MTTVATAVGRALADGGVRHAFGVVGGGNILATAGLTAGGVRYVPARHEGGAMAMADAYHRATGEVAVCTTSHGPGVTNIATGVAEAAKHRSGVLVLCGDAPVARLRPNDIDQTGLAEVLGARVVRITDPAAARADALEALRLARDGSCPVLLCLPADLLGAEVPDGTSPATVPPAAPAQPAVPDLGPVLAVLATARRPLLLAGLGAWRAGAGKPVGELADRLGGLLATTVMANGLFAQHPWSLGICGGFASLRTARTIGEADVVIVFGASMDPFTLHGGIFGPRATVIQVDLAAAPTSARVDLLVRGDAAAVASALLDAVNAGDLAGSAWRVEVADRIDTLGWEHEPYEDASTADRIDPRTLSRALAPLLPEERTLVLDGGHFIGWPAMYWPVSDPAGLAFMGAAFQTIGLGFAGAVGVAVGRTDRTTVAALGDGGALMGLPELETLVRSEASALVVIYDDAAYGFEVHLYEPAGADVRTASFADTDFAGIARSLGAAAVTVRTVADLAAVRAWRDGGCRGTLLLDCKVVRGVVARFLADLVASH
jgi:thiamine pyrophosphate-dependent acetolactate synthase large subunit-like protein